MAATTWVPRHATNLQRRSFLLANGEVVKEPLLEETLTGRKVRVVNSEQSYYSRDIEKLVARNLEGAADARKTRYWMPVDLDGKTVEVAVGFNRHDMPARFEPLNTQNRATAWWSFKHKSMPLTAILVVRLAKNSRGFTVSGRLSMPRMAPYPEEAHDPAVTNETSPNFYATTMSLTGRERERFETFADDAEDGDIRWTKNILRLHSDLLERQAVEKMLQVTREVEGFDHIVIPDLRDVEKPAWLRLELDESNVNAQFIDDLIEYLSGSSGLEHAQQLYQELVSAFGAAGMVMAPTINDNQFMQALLHGNKEALTVTIGQPTLDNDKADAKHVLSVHLPTGTFVVGCSVDKSDNDEVAHAWEESLMLARLTGKEDVLLAYATKYVENNHARRTNKIVTQRIKRLDN